MDANDRGWLGLHDRVCVITGAASGIGRETAIQFATVGARVVAIDRDGNGCSRTAEEVQQQGGAALALECDVSDAESVSAAASRALAAFGRCDILINNAGVLQPGRLEVLSLVDWNALLQINLTGYFLCRAGFRPEHARKGIGRASAYCLDRCGATSRHEWRLQSEQGRGSDAFSSARF